MLATLVLLATILSPNPPPPVSYACDGSTAIFTVNFPYDKYTDLVVTSTTSGGAVTTLAYTTDYTVSVTSSTTTASLTLNAPASSCPNTNILKINRTTARTQPTSFAAQLTYNPALHTKVADRLEMQIQELSSLALGSTISFGPGQLFADSPIIGDGSSGNHLRWNFGVANTWTATQTFTPGSAGAAVVATGFGTNPGGLFTGGTDGIGLNGIGGTTNGIGVKGVGSGSGAGISGLGGSTTGIGVTGVGVGTGTTGVFGTGGPSSGVGVKGSGSGTGAGVTGTGGGTGVGGWGGLFVGQGTASAGVFATGSGSAGGIEATGGATGNGGTFTGGATSGVGVSGTSNGGSGGTFTGGLSGPGVIGQGGPTGSGVIGTAGGTSGVGGLFAGSGANAANFTGLNSGIEATGGAGSYGAALKAGTNGIALSLSPDSNTPLHGPVVFTATNSFPSAPGEGELYYSTTNHVLCWRTNSRWICPISGTITLSAGVGTATMPVSGMNCSCVEATTAANVWKCAVSGTTLTANGTGSDVIGYACN